MYSGNGSVEAAIRMMYPGAVIESIDINCSNHVNQCVNTQTWMQERCHRIPPGSIDLIWASPPCNQYSKANTSGNRDLHQADNLVRHALMAISRVKPRHWLIENPNSLMKSRPYMQPMKRFMHTASYCQFGDSHHKHMYIWTNVQIDLPNCSNQQTGLPISQCRFKKDHGRHKVTAQGNSDSAAHQRVPRNLILAILAAATLQTRDSAQGDIRSTLIRPLIKVTNAGGANPHEPDTEVAPVFFRDDAGNRMPGTPGIQEPDTEAAPVFSREDAGNGMPRAPGMTAWKESGHISYDLATFAAASAYGGLRLVISCRQTARAWGVLSHNWILDYDKRIKPSTKTEGCLYVIWEPGFQFTMMKQADDLVGYSSDCNRYFNSLFKEMSKKFTTPQ